MRVRFCCCLSARARADSGTVSGRGAAPDQGVEQVLESGGACGRTSPELHQPPQSVRPLGRTATVTACCSPSCARQASAACPGLTSAGVPTSAFLLPRHRRQLGIRLKRASLAVAGDQTRSAPTPAVTTELKQQLQPPTRSLCVDLSTSPGSVQLSSVNGTFVARSSGQTWPSSAGWRRSAQLDCPNRRGRARKAGSARSRGFELAWPAPKTSSPSWPEAPRARRSTSRCRCCGVTDNAPHHLLQSGRPP